MDGVAGVQLTRWNRGVGIDQQRWNEEGAASPEFICDQVDTRRNVCVSRCCGNRVGFRV